MNFERVWGCKLTLGDGEQALHREMRGDVGDFGEIFCDQGGVATGGDDGDGVLHFLLEFVEDFFDKAAVAVNGSGEHGLLGGLSDGLCGFGEFDEGQKRGFAMEVIIHGTETRGDHAAAVGGDA